MDYKRVDTSLYVDEWKRLAIAAKEHKTAQRDLVREAILRYLDELEA